jgi:hypothetical protein
MTEPSPPTLPPANPHVYAVYFYVAGGPRLMVSNPNHGITVGDEALASTNYGNAHAAPVATIATIRLQIAALGHADRVIDQYKIEFTDGPAITISNASSSGLPDKNQTPIYRAFVHDLHARLAVHGSGAIRFTAGMAPWRYKMLFGALSAAGLPFIVTPLVLFAVMGDWHVLIPMAMSVSLIWPFIQLMRNNAPRDYTPDALPDELLS